MAAATAKTVAMAAAAEMQWRPYRRQSLVGACLALHPIRLALHPIRDNACRRVAAVRCATWRTPKISEVSLENGSGADGRSIDTGYTLTLSSTAAPTA